MMLTPCEDCGHELRSEIIASGAFRFVVHFDADERSATHGDHTSVCPGCGGCLDLGMMPGPSAGSILGSSAS